MNRYLFSTAVAILMSITVTHAQDPSPTFPSQSADHVTLGLGFGQDYGGFGTNFTVYPQKNVGLFVGAGYAIAGFGYNAGVKLRLLPNHARSSVRPFAEVMYGYTAAVAVANDAQPSSYPSARRMHKIISTSCALRV